MIMGDTTKHSETVTPSCPWGLQEEKLLAKWADRSACYRWLHDEAEKKYSRLNMILTIPVIVLSTLTGTANFGLGSTVPASFQTVAQLGIGGVSLFTGIISTIANYLRYAQRMEAHRGAAISWGKLYRKISVELSLARPIREKCMDFILVCRSEMDRLTEQSPSIPNDILKKFKSEFTKAEVELTDPIKWNDMEKTGAHPVPSEEQVAKAVIAATEQFKNVKLSQFKRMIGVPPPKKPEEPPPAETVIPVAPEEKV